MTVGSVTFVAQLCLVYILFSRWTVFVFFYLRTATGVATTEAKCATSTVAVIVIGPLKPLK